MNGLRTAVVVLALWLGYASPASADLTAHDERQLGQEFDLAARERLALIDAPDVVAYVDEIGQKIVAGLEQGRFAYQFAVVSDPRVNAFAVPGGYVYVHSGLLAAARSDDEVAGVLGHEIAHVVRQHHLTAIRKTAGIGLGADLLVQFGLSKTEHADASAKLLSGAKEVMLRGLDKSDEYEADRMGVVLATRAGYDPYGLPAVLQTLEAISAEDSTVALLFQTHPAPAARLDALEKALGESLDGYAGQPQAAERFHAEMKR